MLDIKMNLSVNAALLAGGKATRLNGMTKGDLEVAPGVTILQSLLQQTTLAGIKEHIIVANQASLYAHYQVPIIPDLRCALGPLAGIESALDFYVKVKGCDKDHSATLFLPCDLPNLKAREIKNLLENFSSSDAPIAYAISAKHGAQPLCAIVKNYLLPEISVCLDQGLFKVSMVWERLGARAIDCDDDSSDAFFNLNDFNDLKRWREQHGQ
jgi:molybdopterin-guanine dinucleotide biosynthesis protein A